MSEIINQKIKELQEALQKEVELLVSKSVSAENFNTFLSRIDGIPKMHLKEIFGEKFLEYIEQIQKLGSKITNEKLYRAS